jgi:hypothetical protein
MRMLLILFCCAAGLRADMAPSAADLSPTAQTAPSSAVAATPVDQAVEQHFQAARKLYLAGDRDAALSELNQALRLDPYHSGSAGLYRTIHEEELSLRQVRLPAPEAPPAAAPQATSSSDKASSPAQSEAGRSFWRGVLNFEGRTTRRLEGLEKGSIQLSGDVGALKSEVEGQKDLLGVVNQDLKRVAVRQDNLMLGLLALLLALVVLLIMTMRMLMNMRGELTTVETRLHEHPAAKRRP